VVYVLHDAENPEAYGGLPKDPQIPMLVKIWKGPLKWLGSLAIFAGIFGVAAHYLRFGPKKVEHESQEAPK
jgi:formate dehydrogenase iron-sulfur subunit